MPALPLYLIANLLFGLNGIIAASIPFESSVIVLSRLILGGGFLGILLLTLRRAAARRGTPFTTLTRRQLVLLVLSGFAMGASWLCLYAGFQTIGVGMTTLLYYTGPVMLMAFLAVTGEDRFAGSQWLGLAAAAAGAALAIGGGAFTLSGGVLIGLLSALCYAAMVWTARRAGHVDGLTAASIGDGRGLSLGADLCVVDGGRLPDRSRRRGGVASLGGVGASQHRRRLRLLLLCGLALERLDRVGGRVPGTHRRVGLLGDLPG